MRQGTRWKQVIWAIGLFLFTASLPVLAITADEAAKLLASDGAEDDEFGTSISLSGSRAVIGAPYDDDNGPYSGSAYVFERDGAGNWTQAAKLLASDGAEYDKFGFSVSISGDRMIIGAYEAYQDSSNGIRSGAAYVFERDGAGNWGQTAKLLASDGDLSDRFGFSVSLSGDRAVIGANGAEITGFTRGSAYFFERDGAGNWSQVAKIPGSGVNSGFGTSVSISGNWAVIGQPYNGAGSAYFVERDGAGNWGQVDTSISWPVPPYHYGLFGRSVSISGDRAVIGAPDDRNYGAVYVLERDGDGNWIGAARLLASDGKNNHDFGTSVAISGDLVLVGASNDHDNGIASGAAYVFERDGAGNWGQTAKLLASDGDVPDRFGDSVSLSGDRAVIGAVQDDDNGAISGSAYVFDLSSDSPITVTVTSPNTPGTFHPGDISTLEWTITGADPCSGIVLSMKRQSYPDPDPDPDPDDPNWYRFTEHDPQPVFTPDLNDGNKCSAVVTIPGGLSEDSDWEFFVRHASSDVSDASDITFGYEEITYNVNLFYSGNGAGSVFFTPEGADCGLDCTTFIDGTVVTLTAEPDLSSVFVGWFIDGQPICVDSGNQCIIEVQMDMDIEVQLGLTPSTAVFHLLIVNKKGGGKGTIKANTTFTNATVICDETCKRIKNKYGEESTVVLKAIPAPGSVFSGWVGEECEGNTSLSCLVTVTYKKRINAYFKKDPVTRPKTLKIVVPKGGAVVSALQGSLGIWDTDELGILCIEKRKCRETFTDIQTINLFAIPDEGYRFDGWTQNEGNGCNDITVQFFRDDELGIDVHESYMCEATLESNVTVRPVFTKLPPPPKVGRFWTCPDIFRDFLIPEPTCQQRWYYEAYFKAMSNALVIDSEIVKYQIEGIIGEHELADAMLQLASAWVKAAEITAGSKDKAIEKVSVKIIENVVHYWPVDVETVKGEAFRVAVETVIGAVGEILSGAPVDPVEWVSTVTDLGIELAAIYNDLSAARDLFEQTRSLNNLNIAYMYLEDYYRKGGNLGQLALYYGLPPGTPEVDMIIKYAKDRGYTDVFTLPFNPTEYIPKDVLDIVGKARKDVKKMARGLGIKLELVE